MVDPVAAAIVAVIALWDSHDKRKRAALALQAAGLITDEQAEQAADAQRARTEQASQQMADQP